MLSREYKKFISERDQTLERFRIKMNYRLSLRIKEFFDEALNQAVLSYNTMGKHTWFTTASRHLIFGLKSYFNSLVPHLTEDLSAIITYTINIVTKLSYASGLEGIARMNGKLATIKDWRPEYDKSLFDKVSISVQALVNKINQEIERAYVGEEGSEELKMRLLKLLPETIMPKRVLKNIRAIEAVDGRLVRGKTAGLSMTTDEMSDMEWNRVLREYMNREVLLDVPDELSRHFRYYRPGESLPSYKHPSDEYYNWQIEQQSTQVYLDSIKNGEEKAAADMGVKDLMWVSVLDEKTRPEHAAKDGLTSTEIANKLEHEWKDFDDKGTVAPSGFNCRCRSVPFIPEKDQIESKDIYKEWGSWLTEE
jgi:hypothetical protein